MSTMKLFVDKISPVCRAVMLFAAVNKIPYEEVHVSLHKRENLTHEQLGVVNPNKRIPAMEDDGFGLFESTAILRYLVTKYQTPQHWYPESDVKTRARVDEALAWFPGNLRCKLFFYSCIHPKRTGKPPDESLVKNATEAMRKSLDVIENYFLKNKKFIGGDNMSIADLLFMCEVTQYWVAQTNLCEGRPNMTRWLADCQKVLGSHFDELHSRVYEVRDSKAYTLPVNLQ